LKGAAALGYRRVPLDRGCAFAVCSGTRRSTYAARAAATRAGVPVIILELGYLRRSSGMSSLVGYNQAGWEKIGWVPPFACPPDRFDALGLHLMEKRAGYKQDTRVNNPVDCILVAGQVGNDAQHGCSSKELGAWLARRLAKLQRADRALAKLPVVFRPHPNQPKAELPPGVIHQRQLPAQVSLTDAIDNARLVLTYNSTAGVDSMLRGVPVVSHPCAHYHKHAVEDYSKRLAYLSRLAFAQWNLSEFESGEALSFLLQHYEK
jgi:capsule polysaccharide export protein KpsC/LpsZ